MTKSNPYTRVDARCSSCDTPLQRVMLEEARVYALVCPEIACTEFHPDVIGWRRREPSDGSERGLREDVHPDHADLRAEVSRNADMGPANAPVELLRTLVVIGAPFAVAVVLVKTLTGTW